MMYHRHQSRTLLRGALFAFLALLILLSPGAVFAQNVFFTITSSAGPNGSISPNGTTTVQIGTSLLFRATPNTGYSVNNWSVDGTVVQTGGTTYSLQNIIANHTVLVTFATTAPTTYTVTPTAGANGTISPSTVQTVNSGGSVTFTATPNAGYSVNAWSLDGTSVQTGGATYTLSNITANHTVNVTFSANPAGTYSVTPTAGANGSISPSTVQTVSSGGSVAFTATPNAGYVVDAWSVNRPRCRPAATATRSTTLPPTIP